MKLSLLFYVIFVLSLCAHKTDATKIELQSTRKGFPTPTHMQQPLAAYGQLHVYKWPP